MSPNRSQITCETRRLALAVALAVATSLVTVLPLHPQEITGTISGSVRDQSGAVVPGATVVATQTETQRSFSTKTNELGLYSFPTLPIGTYQLGAEAAGFRRYLATGLTLHVNERLQVEIALQLGAATQVVEVMAQPTPVNTQSGEVSNLVNGSQVRELPLNGRNFVALTKLVPGTSAGGGLNTFDVGLLGSTHLSVNGNAGNSNLWLVNGVNNSDIGSNATLLVFPSVDAISEFSILRNNYSAEFGFASGGIVNVVTRSGGQAFHGALFEFLRSDKLDAADFFLNRAGRAKNKLRFNNFGWTIGGPVFFPNRYNTDRKRDFFFFAQEWRRQIRGGTILMNVPSARQRLGILDPTCANGSPTPCVSQPPDPMEIVVRMEPNVAPFCMAGVTAPCIVAPGQSPAPGTTLFQPDPNAVAALSRYPLPNTTGAPNFTGSRPAFTKWREDLSRWDHYFSERTNLMLNWTHDTWAQDRTALWGDAPHPTIASDWSQPSNVATARLAHTWNERMLSTFQFNYSDNEIKWVSAKSCPASLCSRQGFTYREIFPETSGQFPTVRNGDGFTLLQHLPPYTNRTDIVQFLTDFSYAFGKHALKVGGTAAWMRKPAPVVASNPTAGNIFARNLQQLLLGNIALYSETETTNPVLTRWRNDAVYVQDNYKVWPNLTLNLGLRWQFVGQPFSAIDNISNFYPNLYNPSQAPTLDATGKVISGTGNPTNGLVTPKSPQASNRSLVENHFADWEPRLGFAYDPFRKGKFVLRGGFGIYHTQDSVDHTVNIGANPPFDQIAFLTNTTFAALGPVVPGTPQPPVGLTALDVNHQNPASYQYSLGFQVAPLRNTMIEMDYVGSRQVHLGRNRDINQVPPSAQPLVAAGAAPGVFRPFKGYELIMLNERAGVARYNSLQVTLNHRMSHGLQLQAAYTLAHCFSDSPNDQNGAGAAPLQDAFHPSLNYAWCGTDQPQNLVINYIWTVPFFHAKQSFLGQALDGWQLSGINTFASGLTTTACLLSDNAGIGNAFPGCERANVVGAVNLSKGSRSVDRYFNTAAFALPPLGAFGNSANNNIRLPGVNNWDFSIYKNFRTPWLGGSLWGEKAEIQFRAEFFNLWNHTQFSGVSTAFGRSDFGKVNSVRTPRDIQFGLKFLW